MDCELLIVQTCEFLDSGDGFYRFHEPSRYLSRLPGVAVIDCDLQHHLLPPLLEAADVLILQDFSWDLFPLIERRRAAGKLTVQEANDDYFDLQPWNVRAAMWQNRSTQGELRQALAAVDAVQTSTPVLAKRFGTWARRVAVFPNQLTHVPPLNPPPERPLTIGWAGSIGHYADWYRVAPLLQTWLEAHPTVHLAVMGGDAVKTFTTLPVERFHYTPGGSLSDYLRFLTTLDIGLAPLLPSDFNRGRSDVKFLEYASAGVAGIYPDLEPYRNSVANGETGLVYRNEHELIAHLDRLASDAAFRHRIRSQAHASVSRERMLADHIASRLAFYRELLPTSRGGTIPEAVLAAAKRDGRYLQLRSGEPENALELATQKPAGVEQVKELRGLVGKFPAFIPALQQLGKSLNELRDFAAASEVFPRVLALDATNATALSELGRARAGVGDTVGARRLLEHAVAVNPYHQVAWQYLLRLLGQKPDAGTAAWAEKAHRQHPDNIMLALQGVKLYPAAERVAVLHRLLEQFAPTFTADERIAAAIVFGRDFVDFTGGQLTTPGVLAFLRRACEVFPSSARFASLLGQSLYGMGHLTEALTQFTRALSQRRDSLVYKQEFPSGDGPVLKGQMAEHIRKWQAAS